MAQYDPALKVETWLFKDVGRQNGERIFQRMKFNFVQYDNDPDRSWIEPVNFAGELKDGTSEAYLLDPSRGSTERPRIKMKFEYFSGHNGNPFSGIHQFD